MAVFNPKDFSRMQEHRKDRTKLDPAGLSFVGASLLRMTMMRDERVAPGTKHWFRSNVSGELITLILEHAEFSNRIKTGTRQLLRISWRIPNDLKWMEYAGTVQSHYWVKGRRFSYGGPGEAPTIEPACEPSRGTSTDYLDSTFHYLQFHNRVVPAQWVCKTMRQTGWLLFGKDVLITPKQATKLGYSYHSRMVLPESKPLTEKKNA